MPEEIVLTVNEFDEIIPSSTRTHAITNHQWRRASGGIIFDPRRDLILSHRRSKVKDERPGVWVCTFGGKVLDGEEIADAARRELYEEFNLKITEDNLHYVGKVKSEQRCQFEYLHVVFVDSQVSVITPDHTEVADFAWISGDHLKKKITQSNWFIYGYELSLLQFARSQRSPTVSP